jgi:hypothetical protein
LALLRLWRLRLLRRKGLVQFLLRRLSRAVGPNHRRLLLLRITGV